MIYQPTSVFPMNNAIDGTVDNTFQYIFKGDKLAAYQIQILENNTNTVVYTGTKTTVTTIYNGDSVEITVPSSTFTNGKNLIWNVTQWESLPSMFVAGGAVQSGSTTTSIKLRQHPTVKANMYLTINGQQRQITSYTYSTGTAVVSPAFSSAPSANTQYQIHTDFTTSPNYFFKARTTPEIEITTFTSPITTRYHSFAATYSQLENVAIKYHTWTLKRVASEVNPVVIKQTEKIFSSNLSFYFDGFISSSDYGYEITLTVVTQDEVEVSITSSFTVSYPTPDVSVPPQITYLPDERGAKIEWVSDALAIPTVVGDYEMLEGKVYIEADSSITYDKISDEPYTILSDSFSIFFSTMFDTSKTGEIISIYGDDNSISLFVDGYYIKSIINDVTNVENSIHPTITGVLTSGAPAANTGYVWDDDDIWDDTKFWTETTSSISEYKFNFVITPTEIRIERFTYELQ